MKRIIKGIVMDDWIVDELHAQISNQLVCLKNILRKWCGIKWRFRGVEQKSHLRYLEGYGNEKVLKKIYIYLFCKERRLL